MPFQVFRRHQRTMMAALAIFAMVAFSLDFSLFRGQFGPGRQDRTVVTLYGKTIRQSDLFAMQAQRSRANRFMYLLTGDPRARDFFGMPDTGSIVDALILQHEADRLGLPASKELAIRWLKDLPNSPLTNEWFARVYHEHFDKEVTDSQLLEDLANQLRIRKAFLLPGDPIVTPYDLFRAYRDQNERVSAFAIPFPVESFVKDAPNPTDAELRAFFDRHKNRLPDRASDTPGFMIPQKIEIEYVAADAAERAHQIEDRLTEKELREVFAARRGDFPVPPPELPVNLFADDPDAKLTPSRRDPFLDVSDTVRRTVARERAQEEIDRAFGQVQDDVMRPFSDKYGAVLDANKEAQDEGKAPQPLPIPGDELKAMAAQLGLQYERTPLLDRETASHYGQIGSSHRGANPMEGGTSFVDLFFDPRHPLYEETELSDDLGRRFLAWKLADVPARVPDLKEVRDEVVHAWKFQKARDLAQKAASDFARKVEAEGYDIEKTAAASGRTVITTSPVPRMLPGMMLSMAHMEPSRPSEILQIPDAGEALRDVLFGLESKQEVKIAPDQPKAVYYVLALNQRFPVDLAGLFGPYGPKFAIGREVESEAAIRLYQSWMQELRRRASLDPNWIPPEGAKEKERRSST